MGGKHLNYDGKLSIVSCTTSTPLPLCAVKAPLMAANYIAGKVQSSREEFRN